MKIIVSRFLPLPALLLALAGMTPPSPAQTPAGTSTRVLANPSGPWFAVDGTNYFQAMAAFWPVGSLHTLSIPSGTGYTTNNNQSVQWQFTGWSWSNGSSTSPTISVIAEPSITQYVASFSSQYLLTLQVACSIGACPSAPGSIGFNNEFYQNFTSWQAPGSTVVLQAFMADGWIFEGWQVGNGPLTPGIVTSVTVNSPQTVTAVYVPAKTIDFVSNPSGLDIYADGVLLVTPTSLQWGLGTSHNLAAITVQADSNDNRWVFNSWGDGGALAHTYVVGNNFSPETISSTYAAAAYPLFQTSPPNLDLTIDGVSLPPPYSFIWGVGSTHTISAPLSQTDSHGVNWAFQSWDDGVATPTRSIAIPPGGYAGRTAIYAKPVQLNVSSSLAGQVVTVDGSPCTTPCSVTRGMGAQVHVTAPATVPLTSVSRQDLLGWSTNGGAPVAGDWVSSLNAANTSIAASYRLMNKLTVSSSPAGAARYTVAPASSDSYFAPQTVVTVAVAGRLGYRFLGWSGALSGSIPAGSVTMNAPQQVVARFDAIPHLTAIGMHNAAGPGPRPEVAAGSVVSLFGESLAPATATGPASPLVRSLGGVTVRLGTRELPLYFASPEQINLQLPPDLEPGARTLTVSSPGAPDRNVDFTVARNAPGLFPVIVEGQTYALVLHEDGSQVTAAAPARQGELLTAYGTGFGPTDRLRPEGAAVPPKAVYRILDPVTLEIGGIPLHPESAFAAPGRVGLDVVQFRLDRSIPAGSAVPLSVTVNGIVSNILPLPIQ